MRRAEIRKLYADACSAVGRIPEESQFESWAAVLGSFEEAAVRRALVSWWGDTTEVSYGSGTRLRGSIMPAPAELKRMVLEAHRAEHEARRFRSCGKCSDGMVLVIRDGVRYATACRCLLSWRQSRVGDAVARVDGKVAAANG